MLTLSRHTGEEIVITIPDHGIMRIKLGEHHCRQTRIIFDAPREIQIDRLETYEKKNGVLLPPLGEPPAPAHDRPRPRPLAVAKP